jgi:peptide/nickel transport system ATP-binding protein
MNQELLLELKDVQKVFTVGGGLGLFSKKVVKAVDHVSLTINKSEILALVGESGSGKSTIAKMILGLLEPTLGEILYKGRSIKEWTKREKKIFYSEVQPIFQDPYSIYNPFYRVERVLETIIKYFKPDDAAETSKIMIKSMEEIGLRPSDVIGRYPHQLSGGERQRLMLARILILKPKLIVADEPTSMIDVSLRVSFLNQLMSFKNNYGISCLYITHDLNNASYISDRMIVLCRANIVEQGPTASIIKQPLHPYTKLLIESISKPNPRQRWKSKLDLSSIPELTGVSRGCIFADRCPCMKDICKQKRSDLVEVEPGRKVACFVNS